MEAAGAVFLPAAGYRWGTDAYHVGNFGLYWSSSPDDEDDAYFRDFNSDGLYATGYYARPGGYSVRPVR